jgi:hypothetical protein
MNRIDKYLGEAKKEISHHNKDNIAADKMLTWMKDIKMKMAKAEKSIKKGQIDLNVVDVFMRMAKVDEEDFFEFFWS